MFLLPAIGAWISDGLILYIYFTRRNSGTQRDVPVAVNSTHHFLDCAEYGAVDCLRRRIREAQDDVFSITDLGRTSSPFGILDEADLIQSGYDISQYKHLLSSDSEAPEDESNNTDDHIGISAETIEASTRYLVILAVIRLTLLTLPLSYAAFYGTRVICVICHYIFEGVSAMVVVSHMMAVLILNPSSFSAKGDTADPIGDSVIDGLDGVVKGNDTLFEDAWALLTLSLVSILLHFLIVLHVRSTAPTTQDWLYEERRRKRKRMAYAMAARSKSIRGKGLGSTDAVLINGESGSEEEEGADETPLLLPGGNGLNSDKNMSNNSQMSFSSEQWRERLRCLPEQYEAFMSEAHMRLNEARRMWMTRLEAASHGQDRDADVENGEIVTASNPTNILTQATKELQKLGRPDPFKVLLQLFAYEDVWTNNRLDLAFSCEPTSTGSIDASSHERRAALSFYAPQLLSFLLHGAYLDISHRLEEWILKQCEEDLHFAHRCFWFLRAWCLGSQKPSHSRSRSGSSLNEFSGSIIALDQTRPSNESLMNKLHGSETNLYLSSLAGTRYQNHTSKSATSLADVENSYLRMNSGEKQSSPSKFSLDERVLIEELLRRIIRRGSKPATKAQYGSGSDEFQMDSDSGGNFANSPSALATAVENGLVPIDPGTGFHSTSHLDCITSPQKYGFLPLNNSGEPYQEERQTDPVSLFLSAPIFLDALLSIADDLMETSRVNRTAGLRQRLRSLEVELLPSNVVYLPIGLANMQHRVWRIVADESIALSTNERVPCIVTMEVVDYSVLSTLTNASGDGATLAAWVNNPRQPKRHITLIDKVATYTQEGLKMLDDKFSQHGDGKGGLDRRVADFLQLRNDSRKKYSPVQMVESGDDDEATSGKEEDPDENVQLEDGLYFELGPPPLGSPTPSVQEEEKHAGSVPPLLVPVVIDDGANVNGHAVKPGPLEAPCTPTKADTPDSPMGQWSTPTSARKPSVKLRKRMNFADEIPEEDSLDNSGSPQAKQRKKVAFPSSSDNRHLNESTSLAATEVSQSSSPVPTVVFKEDWKTKTERLRKSSVYGSHDGWRLLPVLIKSNDDLRQEQLASQLIQRMALILAKANVPVWLKPYEIVALTGRGGIIECVPDTISIDSLKRNDPEFTDLKSFFNQHFGSQGPTVLQDAKANFVESLAAYSMVCFLMQIKDRHNGNILLDNKGHIIHIDFGFYFLSSPGKNSGFESAPFKLTRDFVSLMGGPDSRTFQKFRELCYKTFIELRKNCYQITLLVEMLMEGNEDLGCFRGMPEEAVKGLKERFRLDLNDMACLKYVDSLIDESLENWRTRWYDRYQRFCVGVL